LVSGILEQRAHSKAVPLPDMGSLVKKCPNSRQIYPSNYIGTTINEKGKSIFEAHPHGIF
jgi:hypothetical protein